MAQPQDSRYDPAFPEQILFPEYAIGQKLITRAEYNQLETEYFTQAQAAFGLILPTLLLVFAIHFSGVLRLSGWVYDLIAFVLVVAFLVGMDRLHKFNSDLQLLIVSRYDAVVAAKEQARADAVAKAKHPEQQAMAAVLGDLRNEIAALKQFVSQQPHVTIHNQAGGSQTVSQESV